MVSRRYGGDRPGQGFWKYCIWCPFATGIWYFSVTSQVLSILFFLDFRYSVYRHELNVYFSVEAALLAGQCFTILKYFGILWGKNRVYG